MGAPLRRADGTLVAAHAFADVAATKIPSPQPDLWKAAGSPGYGRAWPDAEQDIPRLPQAGRSEVLSTDRDLQLGPEPGRIARQNDTRIGGLAASGIMATFPYDANMGYMPHQMIGKLVQGAIPQLRTIADDAPIPGVFAGNPVGQ